LGPGSPLPDRESGQTSLILADPGLFIKKKVLMLGETEE